MLWKLEKNNLERKTLSSNYLDCDGFVWLRTFDTREHTQCSDEFCAIFHIRPEFYGNALHWHSDTIDQTRWNILKDGEMSSKRARYRERERGGKTKKERIEQNSHFMFHYKFWWRSVVFASLYSLTTHREITSLKWCFILYSVHAADKPHTHTYTHTQLINIVKLS